MSKTLDATQLAVALLAAREYSRHELQHKLSRHCPDKEAVAQTLDALQEKGLLSDGRFTEHYVGRRIRKGYGPLRIRQELQERGISAELIETRLDLGTGEWQNLLEEAAQHKFGAKIPKAQREQAKYARFLQARGFPEAMVRRYLRDS